MLSLTVGTYPALEKHLAGRLAALAAGRGDNRVLPGPVTVVVPSRTLIRHLTRALPAEHGLAFANVRFHTFQSLARAILLETGVPASALAEDPLVEERIAAQILESGKAGEDLKRLGNAPGLFEALLNSIRDLEEADVDPDELAAAPAGADSAQIAALLPLLRRIKSALDERGLISRTSVIREAGRRAGEADCVTRLAALIYYGAYDLTQRQLDFLLRLAEHAPVEVLFPARASRPGRLHPAHRFAEATLALVSQKARRTQWLADPGRGPLAAACAGIMDEGAAPVPGGVPAGVTLWPASSRAEQWDRIAVESRRLIEQEGYRPHQIAVVARELESAVEPAASAFSAAGCPFSCGFPVPLGSLPGGRALIALVDSLSGDFSPRTVLDAVTSPVTGVAPEGLARDRARMLVRRMWSGAKGEDWASLAAGDERPGPDLDAAEALRAAVKRLAGLAGMFPERDSASGFARRLLDVAGALVSSAQGPRSGERESVAEAFIQALTRLLILDRIENGLSRDDFFRMAHQALAERGARIYESEGGVRLYDVMEARGVSARAVFLADMVEGTFPRVAREDPFLRDPARRHLNEVLGFKIQVRGSESPAEERLLFHSLLDSARERLYVVWHPGEERRPALVSNLVAGLLEDLGLDRVPEAPAPAGPVAVRVEESARLLFEEGARRVRELEDPASEAGPLDGLIGIPHVPAAGLRVTGLVEWARCPFRAYALLRLGIRPPRGPRGPWEPEGATLGTMVHEALSGAIANLKDDWEAAGGGRIAAVCLERLKAAARRHLPELTRFPILGGNLIDEWARLLAETLERDREWCRQRNLVPEAVEFNAEGMIPAGSAELKAGGRIDRLDSGPGLTRLVDYKAHLKREHLPLRPSFSPEFYQLSLYRSLLKERSGVWALSIVHLGHGVGGVHFVHAQDEVAEGIFADAARLNEALASALASGAAWPFPDEEKGRPIRWRPACDVCEFSLACRRDHGPTRERLARAGVWARLKEALAGDGDETDE